LITIKAAWPYERALLADDGGSIALTSRTEAKLERSAWTTTNLLEVALRRYRKPISLGGSRAPKI
jgi:hypothetical protein